MPLASSATRLADLRSRWRRLPRRVVHFLLMPSSPLDLAVLRVVVFALLCSQLLAIESQGMLQPVAITATALALAGIATLVSAGAAVLLSAVALDIASASPLFAAPLFVAAVVAAARSSDALSVDALLLAIRKADHGVVDRLPHSARYGLPLRVAMMVLVVAYLLEARVGAVAGGRWLAVYAATLLPALFWTPTRLAWAASGFFAHLLCPLFRAVGGVWTAALYVMFVPWGRLTAAMGRGLLGEPLVVLYDGNCMMCRRTMNLLLAIDWLDQLRPVSGFDRQRIDALGLGHLGDDDLMRDMHAGERQGGTWRVTKGYGAYQRIAWRVPLLWPTLLVVYLPPVATIGRRVYRHVADTRACAVPVSRDVAVAANRQWAAWFWPLALTVLVVQIAHGLRFAWSVG